MKSKLLIAAAATTVAGSATGLALADDLPLVAQGASPAAPKQTPAQLRNVVGILRGSDASLKETCVLVTAHYDHVGVNPNAEGDRIYNGANDDGSGTVSVVELAGALSKLKQRPKRSIIFVTFFGEEEGLFGSRYYAHHPVFPIAQTVADVNLEQIGRTDDSEGPHVLVILRLRWQIERVFWLWKEHGFIDQWRSKKPWRILSEVYAKLAAMVIQQWLIQLGCW